MDGLHDHQPEDETHDRPQRSEAAIRAMLEQSRRDIEAGRMTPLAPVLDRMRAVARRIRQERTKNGGTDRPA